MKVFVVLKIICLYTILTNLYVISLLESILGSFLALAGFGGIKNNSGGKELQSTQRTQNFLMLIMEMIVN